MSAPTDAVSTPPDFRRVVKSEFRVPSWRERLPTDPPESYVVTRTNGVCHCECDAFRRNNGEHCKHILGLLALEEAGEMP